MGETKSNLYCPNPIRGDEKVVTLAVGEGAKASRSFLEEFIYPRFRSEALAQRKDAARMDAQSSQLAYTTDSFVISPLFFPGGDIGKLAVCGTANDLCMVGAEPKWMSVSLIIEEGFLLSELSLILDSLLVYSQHAQLEVVCGDTKVVPRGKMDGLFINTSAIGVATANTISSETVEGGDVVIVSGPIGCHGMSVMAARTPGLVETEIQSDCGLLLPLVRALVQQGVRVKAMRDATRGGVAAVMHEWASEFSVSITLEEERVPVRDDVRGLTELLGLDPLFVANEGTMVLVVAANEVERTLSAMRSVSVGSNAAVIGTVRSRHRVPVTVVRGLGREIPLDEPTGAPLPRIC